MNNGKSYEYFADLAKMYPSEDPMNRPWDYAMKADDDTLINIPQLVERLRYMRRRLDTYIVESSLGMRLTVGTWNRLLAYGSWIYIIMGFSYMVGQKPN